MRNSIATICCLVMAAASLQAKVSQAQDVASCTEVEGSSYVPRVGSTYIAEDQYSRYIMTSWTWGYQQYMEWFLRPYAPGVSTSGGTYEHDHFFYNYDGLSYANEIWGYVDSNQPSWYVDTQAFDSGNEKAITVGSGDAYGFGSSPGGNWRYTARFSSGGGATSM